MLSKYLTTSSTVNTSANLASISNFEKSGYIGKVYDFFYSTTGTGTAVGNSEKFGREMGQELKVAGVDAVILTST